MTRQKIGVRELVEKANELVDVWSPDQAMNTAHAVLIDLRDIRELEREGTVDKAVHVPRGMLEFWFDEHSPYHKSYLADPEKTYVLYCASGWRSALAAKSLVEMGFDNIAHVDGGFNALKDAGAPIIAKERK